MLVNLRITTIVVQYHFASVTWAVWEKSSHTIDCIVKSLKAVTAFSYWCKSITRDKRIVATLTDLYRVNEFELNGLQHWFSYLFFLYKTKHLPKLTHAQIDTFSLSQPLFPTLFPIDAHAEKGSFYTRCQSPPEESAVDVDTVLWSSFCVRSSVYWLVNVSSIDRQMSISLNSVLAHDASVFIFVPRSRPIICNYQVRSSGTEDPSSSRCRLLIQAGNVSHGSTMTTSISRTFTTESSIIIESSSRSLLINPNGTISIRVKKWTVHDAHQSESG